MKLPLLAFTGLLLAGCAVNRKYTPPTVATPSAYKESPPEAFKENGVWKPAQPADVRTREKWWEVFDDPQLNALEEQIAVDNRSLKAAEARFREARAMIRYNRAAQYPTITTAPGIQSLRTSANRPNIAVKPGPTGDFILPFDLHYEVDLWGRIRGTIAAAKEGTQASAADVETAKLSLQAELALDYFELRGAGADKALVEQSVTAFESARRLAVNRYEGGIAPISDVALAQTQVDSTRVKATDLGLQYSQLEHAIAVLAGKPPAAFSIPPAGMNVYIPEVPAAVPAQLLERRPDIAAAERRVAVANEQIGIARAAFYPSVVLGAAAGLEGNSIVNWLTWPSRFWAVGPSMVQTLFDAGRRKATSESVLANYDATVADYQQTTLSAFQQVEDQLAALRILELEAKQQQQALASARDSKRIAVERYRGGLDNYLQVVYTETAVLMNTRNDLDIQRRRLAATVLLIKALGGGWNVAKLPQFP